MPPRDHVCRSAAVIVLTGPTGSRWLPLGIVSGAFGEWTATGDEHVFFGSGAAIESFLGSSPARYTFPGNAPDDTT